MHVEVLERTASGRVRVRSVHGTFTAWWYGAPPDAGSSHAVEIDVDDVVRAEDVVLGGGPVQGLAGDGDRVRISGLVTEYGADGVLVVMLLDGPPIMIDTDGDLRLGAVGRRATFHASDVTLFPYEV